MFDIILGENSLKPVLENHLRKNMVSENKVFNPFEKYGYLIPQNSGFSKTGCEPVLQICV